MQEVHVAQREVAATVAVTATATATATTTAQKRGGRERGAQFSRHRHTDTHSAAGPDRGAMHTLFDLCHSFTGAARGRCQF